MMINKLSSLIKKAESSKTYLWLFNRVMHYAIPFNKPHGFQVIEISPHCVTIGAPYHKKNFNHVRGIHACAIATVGELAAGIVLMYHFSPKDYRFIMSDMQIEYCYQAKKNITARALFSEEDRQAVTQLLQKNEKAGQLIITEIRDDDQQLISIVKTTWQIKPWKHVKTRV